MFQLKKQKGTVLVVGLIFLVIAMIACISTLENTGILAYEQGNNIQKYRQFYQLESRLNILEKPYLEGQFKLNSLEQLISSQKIKTTSLSTETEFLDDLWEQKNDFIQDDDEYRFLIEYLGTKENLVDDVLVVGNTSLNSWLFRISVSLKDEQGYWLQSMLDVYPLETIEALATLKKPDKEEEVSPTAEKYINLDTTKTPQANMSKRIAWYERLANE